MTLVFSLEKCTVFDILKLSVSERRFQNPNSDNLNEKKLLAA